MRIVSGQPSEHAPARMARLGVLPIFIDLNSKRALVAGGSDAAAWKAELLAAAGAAVEIYAPRETVGDECRRLIFDPGQKGRFAYHDRAWDSDSLAGMDIAVADAATDAEAERFRDAARAAGALSNVVDRPAFCQFQFGSIVNRTPVVVGISTSGAAPILSQAIRRRIETLLPPSLAAWTDLARRLRARLHARLPSSALRRVFWEGFVDRAFGPAPDDAEEAALLDCADRAASTAAESQGRVTLVGAGPGDAELLTLKAVRALQAADAILFDDLVSDEVLELARREAKRILVGKRSGRASCRQDDINELMIKLARDGKHVIRLKSGDPMIFGRAGEEIARLEAEGIPVGIVPGITAGLAMAAVLGVSLTHRDRARSIRFVTGHSREGGLPEDVDWSSLSNPSATTLFYMGGQMAGQIAERLISLGLARETPVIVASALTRPEQTLTHGHLAELSAMVKAHNPNQPILIGVGTVFAPAAKLSAQIMEQASIPSFTAVDRNGGRPSRCSVSV